MSRSLDRDLDKERRKRRGESALAHFDAMSSRGLKGANKRQKVAKDASPLPSPINMDLLSPDSRKQLREVRAAAAGSGCLASRSFLRRWMPCVGLVPCAGTDKVAHTTAALSARRSGPTANWRSCRQPGSSVRLSAAPVGRVVAPSTRRD